MRARQDILEIFATFLQFDADRPHHWATDARLRRSMQQSLEQSSKQDAANFWALYWHKRWHQESARLPEAHLSAYLQEPCYWAAQKTILSFATKQYMLSDCFQVAIAQVNKVLKGFKPQQGFSLQNYASAIFTSTIRDTLRQRQEVDICSHWGLLRKVSQKRLLEALHHAGWGEATIAQYLLAWTCFKTHYVPTQATANRTLPKPDADTWEAIVNQYNQERPTATPPVTAETLEKWLTTSARAARSYLNPAMVSINTPKLGQDSGELLDDVPESQSESLLADLMAVEAEQERQVQQRQLNAVLESAIADFDQPTRSLLQMYYGQAFTQQQMAAALAIQQYTVSRRLSRAREALLMVLAQWSQDSLHIPLSSDVLSYTSTVLEEWLMRHYSQPHDAATME
ncbi:sigma-70 family RNA polymerase sigma factor [Stenomitos frigidus]|uniref:Group 3/4 sigma-70 RNA polymerase sigma factor n=1 Tax=Stenomitos frigidus ULC18 TaxID=2107698 RepID=A0A2T1EBJ5_9CYAN|nr:sigma-70 family RNA polymerase sigma factor [Stenomitos frigidus]PSB30078.1 group 3/4 sigma-70 RNA polymerase sigma factor [Stenomitos frigidus ULC18]